MQKALDVNKRGTDGKIRVLLIIAENFTYKKLRKKFGIRSKFIFIEFIIK